MLGFVCSVQILMRSVAFLLQGSVDTLSVVVKGVIPKVSLNWNLFHHLLALQPWHVSYLTPCDLVLSCITDNGGNSFAGLL